jgi:carboxylesterase type B
VNKDLANFWQKAIVNFARYKDPNPEDSEFWSEYTSENKKVMNIGSPGQSLIPNYKVSVGEDVIDKEKCEYWRQAPYYAPSSSKKTDGYKSYYHQVQERMEM